MRMMMFIALALLLLPFVHAALSDGFARTFVKIDTFFTAQQYKPYAKTIDFLFFTMFFMALYVQIIKYAFKEETKQVKFIAVLLGIMSGFLLTAGGYSVQKLIPYLPWLIYFLLAAFFYRLFVGMDWPKSNGWKLFLSLVLAALLLWLLSHWMFPKSAGGSFFDGAGRISMPSFPGSTGGITPPTSGSGQGNANVPVESEKKSFLSNMPWWGWLLIVLLIALAAGALKFGPRGWGAYGALRARGLANKIASLDRDVRGFEALANQFANQTRQVLSINQRNVLSGNPPGHLTPDLVAALNVQQALRSQLQAIQTRIADEVQDIFSNRWYALLEDSKKQEASAAMRLFAQLQARMLQFESQARLKFLAGRGP
jgi:hypothetical protein